MNPLSMMGMNTSDFSSIGDWLKGVGVTPKSASLAGMQGLTSYGAALASIGQMKRSATQSEAADQMATGDAGVNASAAIAQGYGQVAGLRERLAQTLSQRAALASASGIDVGQGAVADQRRAITDEADTAGTVTAANAQLLASRFRQQQQQLLWKAMQTKQNTDADVAATRSTGLITSLASLAQMFMK